MRILCATSISVRFAVLNLNTTGGNIAKCSVRPDTRHCARHGITGLGDHTARAKWGP
jgi:hypothetical protein